MFCILKINTNNVFLKIIYLQYMFFKIFSILNIIFFTFSCKTLKQPVEAKATTISIPIAGNGFVTEGSEFPRKVISKNGLTYWFDAYRVISVYFKTTQIGQLNVAIKAKVQTGNSQIKVTINGSPFKLKLSENTFKNYNVGTIEVKNPGYVKVDLQGITKTGNYFADVSDLVISGSATDSTVYFASDPKNYYWSRRGPSCHLNYTTPSEDKAYFYSELTVPAGEDKIGSYFMANGFGEGYMGIQVNSKTERRVLFSVWDPEDGKGFTSLIKKSADVVAQQFGGEGTGGQSYLVYNWHPNTTYKFLTKGEPDGEGNTIYTAWFFAPEIGTWQLIASWKRPATNKYLTNFHGFLENFEPENGYMGRKAFWGNQWVKLAKGNWVQVTECKFTVDATAKNLQRMDYKGGSENGQFFMQNGGFFNDNIVPGTFFNIPPNGLTPQVDFTKLP